MHEEFIYCSPENCTEILSIDLAGKSFCDGNYAITRKKSDIYVLEYVLEGSGTIVHNGQKYTASSGEMYLLHKGVKHEYYSSKENPWIKIWINIKGSLIEHLLEVYGLEGVVYPGNGKLLEYLNSFHNELLSGNQTREIQKKCGLLLHKIILSMYENLNVETQQEPDEAMKIKKYLDQHVLDSINLEDLTGCFYKSKAQIIRVFKKKYGITPYAYLLNTKLQYAKKLLANTHISIKEIASRINFADEHYFSTYFKKIENISPSFYRLDSNVHG